MERAPRAGVWNEPAQECLTNARSNSTTTMSATDDDVRYVVHPARIGEAHAALSLRAASANFSCNSASRALLASSCWVSSSFYRSCTSFCVLAARSAASSWPSRKATRACNYFWATAAIIFRSCSMNAGSMRDPLCPPRAAQGSRPTVPNAVADAEEEADCNILASIAQ